jgi:hypothetical protein
MTVSPSSPGLILGGGASAFGNGQDDPNALAQIYQNLLSGAADVVAGLKGNVLDISSGAIGLAGSVQVQAKGETAQGVANNLRILGSIAAFCKANGIVVQVDADLTYGVLNGDGTNALVDQWATAAAAVGLPIASVQDVQQIGINQSEATFASYASIEVNAVQSLIHDYAASSYRMTAGNLAVGDMEGGGASSMTAISEWWQAYDAAATTAGVQDFSFVTADTGWDVPWTWPNCTLAWQAYLEHLSALAVSDGMSLNVDLQGMQTDTSGSQFVAQAEQNAAELAMLAGTGSIVVGNLEIQTWQQLPVGVSQIASPTSSTNIAAEVDATYPLYAAGSITAQGPIAASAPGQAIVTTGAATSIVPLSVQWDAADVRAGYRLGVVIIDQTGTLSATQHGAGTVADPAANILVLSGNSADLAAELSTIKLTEPNSGPDTIDVETFGTAGQLSDSQISVLALNSGQNPSQINATSNLQGWVSSSAFLNGGNVITSETLHWNTTGVLAGTISGTTPGQSAFVKLDAVHEPLAEYGVEHATTFDGVAINAVADVNDPAVVNPGDIQTAGGAANDPGQDITLGLESWVSGVFDPTQPATLLTVQSTTNTFNPVSGQLETSVDSLAPDPLTVVNLSGTAVANAFATQFNTGGTQVTEYNTPNNPAWQAGWGSQFNSATLTYDDIGKLVEEFLQGGPSNPTFTIDDVFDPNTGKLWEQFQSSAPPPLASYPYPVAGFATGPLYVTEFNTGDNPNWDYLDWGTAIASDTEILTDYYLMQNSAGFFVDNAPSSYYYEFTNGSTLDLLNLPGAITVNLNALGSVVIDSQTLASGLSNLTAIDAAGATGTVTLTGLAAGGSTLIGGNAVSTITGYGHDTIVAGNGTSTINTGSGGSTVLVSGTAGTARINGNNNVVIAATPGNNVTVTGSGDTVTAVAGATVTGAAANTSLSVNGSSVTTGGAAGDTITATGTADVVNFVNGGTVVLGSAGSSATVKGNSVTVSINAAGGTVTAANSNNTVTGGANAVVNLSGVDDTANLGNYATVWVTGVADTIDVQSNGSITLLGGLDVAIASGNTTAAVERNNGETVTAGNNVTAYMYFTSDTLIAGDTVDAWMYGASETLIAGNAATIDLAGSLDVANLGSAAYTSEYGFDARETLQANGYINQKGTGEIAVAGAYTTGWQRGVEGQLTAGDHSTATQVGNSNTASVGNYSAITATGTYDVGTLLANGAIDIAGKSDSIVAGTSAVAKITGNSETLTVGSNSSVSVGNNATGEIINVTSSTVTLGNNVSARISGSGSIINHGIASSVILAAQSTMTIAAGASLAAVITNTGSIDLTSGTLVFHQPVTTSATFLLGGTATLDFVSTVAGGAGMRFIQPGGTLEVQAAGSFGPHISRFAAGDRIDAAAVLYGLAPKVNYSAGILTVTDGTRTDSFALVGTYIAADFHLASDGHSGTAISYT